MIRRTLLSISILSAGTMMTVAAQSPKSVTAQDKAEIQALVTAYARTLGSCAADEYADLFAPQSGSFDSGFRGHVVGRERLVAMVRSERQCTAPPQGTTPAPRPAPTVVVDVTPAGVFGIADLGAAGHYEDEYTKTPKGWRFAARTVITPAEQAAGLNAREMMAIRRLASGPDDAEDFWAAGQDGVKRFRSAGVVILVAAGQVTGRVYLKDGGSYDDVYEKNARGQWRFKTRTYVAAGT
jgi:hypothetical protein